MKALVLLALTSINHLIPFTETAEPLQQSYSNDELNQDLISNG